MAIVLFAIYLIPDVEIPHSTIKKADKTAMQTAFTHYGVNFLCKKNWNTSKSLRGQR